MNDAVLNPPPDPPRRTRKAPQPEGEITRINVPKPSASAMNPHRPVSDLIKAQLRHMQHAESARLPRNKRSAINLNDIQTEAQAAEYIREVTRLLHPNGRKRPARKPKN
jgi:hypothetical protein